MMININDERKKLLQARIHNFFLEEYDLDLGLIGQGKVLDFFLDEMGNEIYNEALDEALKFIKYQQENMELDFCTLYKDR